MAIPRHDVALASVPLDVLRTQLLAGGLLPKLVFHDLIRTQAHFILTFNSDSGYWARSHVYGVYAFRCEPSMKCEQLLVAGPLF